MKVFTVLWHDRHCEPTAKPFATLDAAIAYAREQKAEFDRFGDWEERTPPAGWLFLVHYGAENSIWITEDEMAVS